MSTRRRIADEGLDQDRFTKKQVSVERDARLADTRKVNAEVIQHLRGHDGSQAAAAVDAARVVPTGRRRGPERVRSDQAEAVLYLRVSTKEQAEAGGEVEGYSIPAQREACKKQAKELGAIVVDEYVDRGESARSANRPELQRLLADVKTRPGIRYVIVHKIDRLARNREDDIAINVALKKADVQLVSCSERIDDTPTGMLLYGLMAELAQFYSRNLAQEVLKGLTQKAKSGGTPYKAPIGYLNVRSLDGGKDVRSIAIDPERADLVRWCIEQYATGDWTTMNLLDAATAKGLRTRPGGKLVSKPLSLNGFIFMLKSPYYIGVVSYRGIQYHGSHEALVTPEVWLRVQDVLATHDKAGEKTRRHPHYLKGSIFCAKCESRLCFTRNKGNGGSYDYFFCLGKSRYRFACPMKYVKVDAVETAVEAYYARLQLSPTRVESIKTTVGAELAIETTAAEEEARRQAKLIDKLSQEREKVLQAHYADAIPLDLMRQEMDRITRETAAAEAQLAACQTRYQDVQDVLARALELAGSCLAQYQEASNAVRRQFNQGFFKAIYIDDAGQVERVELTEPFASLLAGDLMERLETERRQAKAYRRSSRTTNGSLAQGDEPPRDPLSPWLGSNERTLVELEGIEPSSVGRSPPALRPFPCLWLNGCQPAGSGGPEGPTASSFRGVSVLSRRQRSLPAVRHRFCCRAAVARPRVPLLVPMTPSQPRN
jgi:site-specific DNA recombinase